MAVSVDNYSDLEELGIDLETDPLTENFHKAATHVQSLASNLDNETLLLLYGYYKQSSQGPCNVPKPSWYDMKGKAKWEAWHKLGDMSQKEAQKMYIETVEKISDFSSSKNEKWVSVSTFKKHPPDFTAKNLIDFIKDHHFNEVKNAIETLDDPGTVINGIDEQGLSLIHWAADIGSVKILEFLIDKGADVNLQDSDGQTALHYASSCGHSDCVKLLLSKGARADVLDNDQATACDVAIDDSVKELLISSSST